MRDHVTFLSDAFNMTEVKDNFINPCCFGEDLALWLASHLVPEESLETDPEPCQEDWGWEILLSCMGKRFLIGIGQYEAGWLCFIQSELPFYRKWFGVRDDAERQLICESVHRVLQSGAEITQIRWHRRQDFMRGNEDDWAEAPNTEPRDALDGDSAGAP